MFHKKYTVKEEQALGKSVSKKLKDEIVSTVAPLFRPIYDAVWDKKPTVMKRRWQFASGASAIIYFISDVPLFIQVDGFPDEAEQILGNEVRKRVVVPTLFFILRAWMHLQNSISTFSAFVKDLAIPVICRGPTSKFIVSGAHLMMPGIIGARDGNSIRNVGSKAAIFSLGTDVPYAVGVGTKNLHEGTADGTGVFIIHCYCDNLWTQYKDVFMASCGPLSSETIRIPPAFCDGYVMESVREAGEVIGEPAESPESVEENTTEDGGAEGVDSSATNNGDAVGVSAGDHIDGTGNVASPVSFNCEDEEQLLQFCLCEGLNSITNSMLPIPLTQFTNAVISAYPRGTQRSKPLEFKNTSYKKALAFFHKFPEIIEITELNKGVHCVTKIRKNSLLMKEHKKKYQTFLERTHRPCLEEEAREAEARMLQDSKIVFEQTILSMCSCYKPRKQISESLVRVLLLGSTTAGMAKPLFPTLSQMEAGEVKPMENIEESIDDSVYQELYSRKIITDNLKAYVRANNLLVVPTDSGDKGLLPDVKMEGALAEVCSGSAGTQISLNQAEECCLKLFTLMHEIVLQTNVVGSALTTSTIPPRHYLKTGALPQVFMWTEKRSGNKDITILKNLEAFGLNSNLLSRAWKQRLSTSCNIYDPSQEMSNLKNGTKIPLEIHLQGKMVAKMENILKEIGIPPQQIVNSRR